jgi:hypothetical protein
MTASKAAIRWCSVYTRKSTEEGLEQQFNSLNAQREAAEVAAIRRWITHLSHRLHCFIAVDLAETSSLS